MFPAAEWCWQWFFYNTIFYQTFEIRFLNMTRDDNLRILTVFSALAIKTSTFLTPPSFHSRFLHPSELGVRQPRGLRGRQRREGVQPHLPPPGQWPRITYCIIRWFWWFEMTDSESYVKSLATHHTTSTIKAEFQDNCVHLYTINSDKLLLRRMFSVALFCNNP